MKNFNNEKFKQDLKWGNFIEFSTIPHIEYFFNNKLEPKNKKMRFLQENISKDKKVLKDWDLKFGIYENNSIFLSKEIFFEVKGDKFDCTGNLFFEKTCSNKPSGVFATKSDYFIYFLPRYLEQNFYIIKSSDLISLLTEKFSHNISYGGGDGGKVSSFLINKQDFDKEFIKIGKILDISITIPEEFGVEKFKKENVYTYHSDTLKKYENPL